MNRLGILLVIAVFSSGPGYGQVADRIYRGGEIVTVNDAKPFAEAVAIKDGRILAAGQPHLALRKKVFAAGLPKKMLAAKDFSELILFAFRSPWNGYKAQPR